MGNSPARSIVVEEKAVDRLRDIAVVGAGPAGLTFALQVLECFPAAKITFYEKHKEYIRDHPVRWKPQSVFAQGYFLDGSDWLNAIRTLPRPLMPIQSLQNAFLTLAVKKGATVVQAEIDSIAQVRGGWCLFYIWLRVVFSS